jgi:hypothetical protein
VIVPKPSQLATTQRRTGATALESAKLDSIKFDSIKLALAFAAIYLVWGSTYLAIRYAVETIPPLVTAGIRHTIAGGILMAWAWARGYRPRREHWVAGMVLGALFFLVGRAADCDRANVYSGACLGERAAEDQPEKCAGLGCRRSRCGHPHRR